MSKINAALFIFATFTTAQAADRLQAIPTPAIPAAAVSVAAPSVSVAAPSVSAVTASVSAVAPSAQVNCDTGYALADNPNLTGSQWSTLPFNSISVEKLATKSFGFTTKSLVVRLDCALVPGIAPLKMNFFVRYPILDHIAIYEIGDTSELKLINRLGDVDRAQAPTDAHDSVVPYFSGQFSSGEHHKYLMVLSSEGSLQAPLVLKNSDDSIRLAEPLNFTAGIYYGLVFAMIFFNLFLYFSLRDSLYLKYVLYVFFFTVFQSAADGFGNFYFWNRNEFLTRFAVPVSIPLFLGFILVFSRHYLKLSDLAPRISKLFGVMSWSLFALALVSFKIPYHVSSIMGAIGSPVVAAIALVASSHVWRKGFMPAKYFFLAWVVFLTGMVMMSLRNLGLVPHSFITTYAIQIGSGMEAMLIAFGLAYRIRTLTEEKDVASLENNRLKVESVVLVETANLASQVSHDIRSPLAALDMALNEVSQLPAENRLVVRSALNRIRDIANNLLSERKAKLEQSRQIVGQPAMAANVSTEAALLCGLLESLVSEKRFQHRPLKNVSMDFEINAENSNLFAQINSTGLKRLLSNLIENSIEARLNDQALCISLSLSATANQITIEVSDNGQGMPLDLIKDFNRGNYRSHGKQQSQVSGSGLGVSHAASVLKSWQGSLSFAPHANGSGTVVTVTLPRAETQSWLADSIEIATGAQVFVVDDDDSVHSIWRKRLDPSAHQGLSANVAYVNSLESFATQLKRDVTSELKLFIDFEFLNETKNGLQFIEEMGLAAQSVLVTSRHDEPAVLQAATRLGLKILPKSLLALVPIQIKVSTVTRFLLDDDSLMHMSWNFQAKKRGEQLKAFSTEKALLEALDQLPKSERTSALIYVDFSLGSSERSGVEILKTLHANGYKNLFICSGYSNIQSSVEYQICGKDYPSAA